MVYQKVATLLYLALSHLLSVEAYENTPVLRRRTQGKSGDQCALRADIECKIKFSGGKSCDELPVSRGEECGDKDILIRYIICNDMSSDIISLLPDLTIAKYKDEDVKYFNNGVQTIIPAETCRTVPRTRTINTCGGRMTISLKVEGWVEGFTGVDGYYCFDYKFMNTKLAIPSPTPAPKQIPMIPNTSRPVKAPTRTLTKAPIKNPTEVPIKSPTKVPINKPTKAPIDSPSKAPRERSPAPTTKLIEPKVSLDIECSFRRSNSNLSYRPCDEMQNSFIDRADCNQDLRYEYIITNKSNHPVRAQGIVVRQKGSLVHLPVNNNPMTPGYSRVVVNSVEKNLCALNGNEVRSTAIAFAANAAGGIPGSDRESYAFNVPDIPLKWKMNDGVGCFIDGTGNTKTCNQFIKDISDGTECIVDVVFKYNIENTGIACDNIHTIDAIMSGGAPKGLALESINSCANKDFCPGDELIIDDKRSIDLCALQGTKVGFDVILNNNDDKQVGFHKYDSAPGPPPEPIQCLQRPCEMYFVFEERLCTASDNEFMNYGRRNLHEEQRLLKGKSKKNSDDDNYSSYFSCRDFCEFTSPSTVIITDIDGYEEYFRGDVKFGDVITIKSSSGELDSNTMVRIKDQQRDRTAQEFTFHSSCSKPLFTGDTFGALRLIGWKNYSQGTVRYDV